MSEFEDFIRRSCLYPALQFQSVDSIEKPPKQLVVIEHWPIVGTDYSHARRFHAIMQWLEARSAYPVVIIYSDLADQKANTTVLSKLFSSQVMDSPATQIINCNPVSTGRF